MEDLCVCRRQGLIRLGAGRAAAQRWPICDPVLGVPQASTEQTHSPRCDLPGRGRERFEGKLFFNEGKILSQMLNRKPAYSTQKMAPPGKVGPTSLRLARVGISFLIFIGWPAFGLGSPRRPPNAELPCGQRQVFLRTRICGYDSRSPEPSVSLKTRESSRKGASESPPVHTLRYPDLAPGPGSLRDAALLPKLSAMVPGEPNRRLVF